MLRPNRREGDGSGGSLKVVGTARVTLSPWSGGELRDTGKVPVSPRPGDGHSSPLSVTPPGTEPSLETSGSCSKAKEKTYGKKETREPHKTHLHLER